MSCLYEKKYPAVSVQAVGKVPSPLAWHSPVNEVFTDLHVGRSTTADATPSVAWVSLVVLDAPRDTSSVCVRVLMVHGDSRIDHEHAWSGTRVLKQLTWLLVLKPIARVAPTAWLTNPTTG